MVEIAGHPDIVGQLGRCTSGEGKHPGLMNILDLIHHAAKETDKVSLFELGCGAGIVSGEGRSAFGRESVTELCGTVEGLESNPRGDVHCHEVILGGGLCLSNSGRGREHTDDNVIAIYNTVRLAEGQPAACRQ